MQSLELRPDGGHTTRLSEDDDDDLSELERGRTEVVGFVIFLEEDEEVSRPPKPPDNDEVFFVVVVTEVPGPGLPKEDRLLVRVLVFLEVVQVSFFLLRNARRHNARQIPQRSNSKRTAKIMIRIKPHTGRPPGPITPLGYT